MRKTKWVLFTLISTFLLVFYSNCGQTTLSGSNHPNGVSNPGVRGTSGGNPLVTLSAGAFSSVDLSALLLCIKHIDLFSSNKKVHGFNVNSGAFLASPDGEELLSLKVIPGNFQEIDVSITDACPENVSMAAKKNSGNLSFHGVATLRFFASPTTNTTSGSITLNLQSFVDALNSANPQTDIKTLLDGTVGTY